MSPSVRKHLVVLYELCVFSRTERQIQSVTEAMHDKQPNANLLCWKIVVMFGQRNICLFQINHADIERTL